MRDFFKNKMAALLARLDQALLQQERVEVAELAAEHWRKAAVAAEEGRKAAVAEVDDARRRWAGEVFELQRLRDKLEQQLDSARADQSPKFSHDGVTFTATGNPWLTTEAKVAALWSCIQGDHREDVLGHLFDLLHRYKGDRTLAEAAAIWGRNPQPEPTKDKGDDDGE